MRRDRRGAPTAHCPASVAGRGGGPVARLYLRLSMLAVPGKSSHSGRILNMIAPGIIEPVSGDHPRSVGQGCNVLCRRLKPARHRGVVPGDNLARLTRHRRVMRRFNSCRRRREQAPHKFPMIIVHIAPPPNFRQERFLCGESPGDRSSGLDRRWRMSPAHRDHRIARPAVRAYSRDRAARLARASAFAFLPSAMASSGVSVAGTTKHPRLE